MRIKWLIKPGKVGVSDKTVRRPLALQKRVWYMHGRLCQVMQLLKMKMRELGHAGQEAELFYLIAQT